jgi:hypothetical protein
MDLTHKYSAPEDSGNHLSMGVKASDAKDGAPFYIQQVDIEFS